MNLNVYRDYRPSPMKRKEFERNLELKRREISLVRGWMGGESVTYIQLPIWYEVYIDDRGRTKARKTYLIEEE